MNRPERPMADDVPRGPRIDDIRDYRGSFVGIAGLVCLPFLIWGAYAVYGVGASLALTAAWLLLLSFGFVWFSRHPSRVALLPLPGFLAWLVAVLVARN